MGALPPLAVTGSTGALGRLVARELAAAGVAQRLLARTAAKVPALEGAVALPFSYTDKTAATEALQGATTLFMVSASEAPGRVEEHRAFVDTAAAAGVEHVVYTSFHGAAPDCTFTLGRDHFATEEHIKASGMSWTFLRDNLYLDFLPHMVGDDGVIRGPAGSGRVAAVAQADIARSAAAVLQYPGAHRETTYGMTGPEALTMADVARIMTEHSGRQVTFHDETVEEAYESRRRWAAPQWQYDAWVSTYTAIANGELAGVTDDVRRLTGREALGLRDLLTSTE